MFSDNEAISRTPHGGYTPYEGLNLANRKNRKLEVFGRKLQENYSEFYIFINISENESMILKKNLKP